MRGKDGRSDALFLHVSCEARVPSDHPLRPIRALVDEALEVMSPAFEGLYSQVGRPSIPPEKLLRALLWKQPPPLPLPRGGANQIAPSSLWGGASGWGTIGTLKTIPRDSTRSDSARGVLRRAFRGVPKKIRAAPPRERRPLLPCVVVGSYSNTISTRRFCGSRTPSGVGTSGSRSPFQAIEIISAGTPKRMIWSRTVSARCSDSPML